MNEAKTLAESQSAEALNATAVAAEATQKAKKKAEKDALQELSKP